MKGKLFLKGTVFFNMYKNIAPFYPNKHYSVAAKSSVLWYHGFNCIVIVICLLKEFVITYVSISIITLSKGNFITSLFLVTLL